MILTHLVLFSFLAGAGGEAAAPAETFSGGWGRPLSRWAAEETDTEHRARIHAERVKLGILPPDPVPPAAVEAPGGEIEGVPATLLSPNPALALDLAQLYTSAYLDAEIRRHFRILDDDDAAVLLLAIAALY